jgi:hypothetical protein
MRLTWMAAVALSLMGADGLLAQDSAAVKKEKRFTWSLLGGATFNTLTGVAADTAGLNSRVGFTGGIGLEFEMSKRFALEVKAALTLKGAKQPTVTNQPGLGYQLLYAEFPLVLKFNLAPGAKWQPMLLAGGSMAFELDCKMPFLYVNSVVDSNCYSNDYERETTELGGIAGIELHRGMWFLTGRYMMGFSSLLVGEGAPELKNSGFVLGLGITF